MIPQPQKQDMYSSLNLVRLAWLLSISVSCSRSLFFRKVWRTWQSLKYVNHHLVASLQHQLWRHTTKAQIVRTKFIALTLRKNCTPKNSNASTSFLTKIIHHLCNTPHTVEKFKNFSVQSVHNDFPEPQTTDLHM